MCCTCLYRLLQCSAHWFRTAVLSVRIFSLLSSMTADLLCFPSGYFHCCLRWLLTYAVAYWWEPWGCCRPLCCFLTSFPSLCSCTALQSTLHLLSLSSSQLLCLFFCTLVLRQCLCTSTVLAAISDCTDPEPRLWPKQSCTAVYYRKITDVCASLSFRKLCIQNYLPRESTNLCFTSKIFCIATCTHIQ